MEAIITCKVFDRIHFPEMYTNHSILIWKCVLLEMKVGKLISATFSCTLILIPLVRTDFVKLEIDTKVGPHILNISGDAI